MSTYKQTISVTLTIKFKFYIPSIELLYLSHEIINAAKDITSEKNDNIKDNFFKIYSLLYLHILSHSYQLAQLPPPQIIPY